MSLFQFNKEFFVGSLYHKFMGSARPEKNCYGNAAKICEMTELLKHKPRDARKSSPKMEALDLESGPFY